MYKQQVRAAVKAGKLMEAIQVVKEIAAYVNEKYPDTNSQVFTESFGTAGIIYWQGNASDMANMEARNDQLATEPAFQELLMKYTDLVVEGSVKTTLMRQV